MGVQWGKVISVPIWCWKKSWQGFSWRRSSNLILREQQLKEEWHVRADTWTRSGLDRRGERSRGAFTHGCVCVCEWHEATGKGKLLHVFACTVPTNQMQCRTEVCVFMCVYMEADNAEVRPPTLGELTRTCDSIQASSSVSTAQRGVTMMTADVQ